MNDTTPDFSKDNGLLPAVVQHCDTGRVLMVGYMNEDAYRSTVTTGRVTFFSRSKGRLWVKGESSGNWLTVRSIALDCDSDAVLIQALPAGPTCHTGSTSCFDAAGSAETHEPFGAFLSELSTTIRERHTQGGSDSYTAALFTSGLDRIVQKVGEEGVEVVIAGKNGDTDKLVDESADLLFHLMILLEARGLALSDVEKRLRLRRK
jgi:phosphoribosyl-ATP pyrophosphohydrolase/phosphoribosyl-AMP cyclohydrolase